MNQSPTQYGRYLLLNRVAIGGMAEVFRAKYFSIEGFEKIVALKRILPEYCQDEDFVEMFIDEARLTSKLHHGNVVQVLDFGKIDESYYLAMEFIDGANLRNLQRKMLKMEQKFPINWAIHIVIQILKALDYASRLKDSKSQPLNIVHRDISPQNILISREAEVKITDFGIAKAAHRLSKTQPGKIQGKFGYMSPEQAHGSSLDQRSDIFSLGIIFFEMLSGRSLYDGQDTFAKYEQVKNARVPPPSRYNPDVPKEYEKICLKMLRRDAKNRYQNAREVLNALSQAKPSLNSEKASVEISEMIQQIFPEIPIPEIPLIESEQGIAGERGPFLPQASKNFATKSSIPPQKKKGGNKVFILLLLLFIFAFYFKFNKPLNAYFKNISGKVIALFSQEEVGDQPLPREEVATPTPTIDPKLVTIDKERLEEISRQAELNEEALAEAKKQQEELLQQAANAEKKLAQKRSDEQQALKKLAALAKTKTEKCPPGMIFIKSGPFVFGSATNDPDRNFAEPLQNTIDLPAYCIDRFEQPNKKGVKPSAQISWQAAKNNCEKQSKRLCSAEEWEKACKGETDNRYPYGNNWQSDYCNTEDKNGIDRKLTASGSAKRCLSPFKVFDMSGNLAEYTAAVSPRDPALRIVRGGFFGSPGYAARCSSFIEIASDKKRPYIGFRCCRDANF